MWMKLSNNMVTSTWVHLWYEPKVMGLVKCQTQYTWIQPWDESKAQWI
jgi:hypothetical protein